MSITDPLADMFTVIRNASRAKKDKLDLPASKLKMEVLKVIKQEGYIKNFKYIGDTKPGVIRVYLKFTKDKTPIITEIKRISKPGLRVYVAKDKIPHVLRGMGTAVLSTSSGVLTDVQARSQRVGGEVICHLW